MAGKAKNTPGAHFPAGKGSGGVRDMALPSLENLGAKFSEKSFPHFLKTYFTQIGHCYHFYPTILHSQH